MKDKNILKNAIKLVILITLFFYRNIFILPIVYIANINTDKIPSSTEVVLSLISNMIFLIITVLMYKKDLIKEWKIFRKNMSENVDTSIKYWLLGLAVMAVSNIIINFVLGGGQATNEKGVQKMIDSAPFIMLLAAGIVAPINEELLFRKGFKSIINNKWLFILISGVVFGYLHVISAKSLEQFLFIIPYSSLGIAFATAYYKTDTVFSSIFVHMLHNTILTLLSILV